MSLFVCNMSVHICSLCLCVFVHKRVCAYVDVCVWKIFCVSLYMCERVDVYVCFCYDDDIMMIIFDHVICLFPPLLLLFMATEGCKMFLFLFRVYVTYLNATRTLPVQQVKPSTWTKPLCSREINKQPSSTSEREINSPNDVPFRPALGPASTTIAPVPAPPGKRQAATALPPSSSDSSQCGRPSSSRSLWFLVVAGHRARWNTLSKDSAMSRRRSTPKNSGISTCCIRFTGLCRSCWTATGSM